MVQIIPVLVNVIRGSEGIYVHWSRLSVDGYTRLLVTAAETQVFHYLENCMEKD